VPEGHSVHRITRQFAQHFVGKRIHATSPQGRFASDAKLIDGHVMTAAKAVGKQMFLEFDNGLWLRVHLGIYGAWDFAGDFTVDATTASANGRMGQTNQRGTALLDGTEDSLSSIGAPRRTRLRMSEQEVLSDSDGAFPPDPIGAVRVRLLSDDTVADLRGPTACEVIDPESVQRHLDGLGPDPMVDKGRKAEDRFVNAVLRKPTPIALLLMDQSIVAGIGNVYRAELLFRARIDPYTPGRRLTEEQARALWRDWVKLLRIGVQTGQMLTMDGLRGRKYTNAMAYRADRHWVYHRAGEPCRVCGTPISQAEINTRNLYWCSQCQSGAAGPAAPSQGTGEVASP
jgi:endonuclease-8